MSLGTVSQVNYLPEEFAQYSVKGYASIGLTVAGSITSMEYLTLQGSNDGETWSDIPVAEPTANGNNQLADGKITAEGNYIVNTVNYGLIKVVPSDTFTGKVTLTADISTRITPPFTVGFGA